MGTRRWTLRSCTCALGAMGLALSACGSTAEPTTEPSPLATVELPAFGSATDTVTAQVLDQPAIWPAAEVVFATPEEAAADFVSAVLISEGDPVLGDFQQGDSRSGEITVLFAGESGELDPPLSSGLLVLRQIGPTDGWYVIAAMSEGVVIENPSALERVPPGIVTVSGEGRGFEGTLVVSAFPPGSATTFDVQIGAGGAMEELEPYSVDLDLSGAADGDVVVILVHGATGLGSDPGTFAAFPIVIASETTPTTTAPTTVPPTTLPPTK